MFPTQSQLLGPFQQSSEKHLFSDFYRKGPRSCDWFPTKYGYENKTQTYTNVYEKLDNVSEDENFLFF